MAFLLALVLLLTLNRTCLPSIVNVTIDDADGDPHTGLKPQYTKDWFTMRDSRQLVNYWNVDTTEIYGHSLSSISAFSGTANISLTFNGTNIWAYYAINTRYGMDMLFYIDDEEKPSGTFHKANSSDVTAWEYNQLLFASKSLTQGTHTLTMSITLAVPFFDYAIYSTDDGEVHAADPLPGASSSTGSGASTTPKHLKPPAQQKLTEIIVPVVGGAALIAAFCAWSLARRRRRLRSQDHTTAWQEPQGMVDLAADTSALGGADARAEKAITPYAAQPQIREQPDTAVLKQRLINAILGPKESVDAGDPIAPFGPVPSLNLAEGPNNDRPRVEGQPKRRAIVEIMVELDPLSATNADQAQGESTAEIRVELERVSAEAEQALAENEMLRQAAEPPPYANGGRSERGSISARRGRL